MSLHDLLLERIDELVGELLPEAQRFQREFRVGSINGERGTSLSISAQTGLWMDHNPGAPEPRQGNLLTLIQATQGLSPKEAVAWAKEWLRSRGVELNGWDENRWGQVRRRKAGGASRSRASSAQVLQASAPPSTSGTQEPENREALFSDPRFLDLLKPKNGQGEPLSPASDEVATRHMKRLLQTEAAMEYLRGRGLDARVVRRFYLGLDDPSRTKNALVYPLMGPDGVPVRRYLYYTIPGLTEGGKGKGWASGKPATYWAIPPFEGSTVRRRLFICEGAKDGWMLWLKLMGQSWARDLAVATSTHGSAVPEAWQDPLFWTPWEEVYLGQDNDDAGEEMARKVAALAKRPVVRVRVPKEMGKDWTDYFASQGTPESFRLLLEAGERWNQDEDQEENPVRLPQPVDVNRAFVGGYLYVPVRILENLEMNGARYRTVVIRSDGEVLNWGYLHAPRNTPLEDRVLALDDGTIIRKPPKASMGSPWSERAINRFLKARKQGRSAMTLSPTDLPRLIAKHLRQVILPRESDYTLASLVVMTSYVQAIFDAVPLVLIVGPPGSGKTELARLMAEVGANGVVITGQTSAATAARIIDETGGLVAFDDLEEVRQRSGSAEASHLEQFLKVSYKKETALKQWTDTKGMKVQTLNFFGVKVITNTQGTGEILGSRMFTIRTVRLKDLGRQERPQGLSPEGLQELRDNLYIWAMENASDLHRLYRERFAETTDRLGEIAAPLRTIANYLGDADLINSLEEALRREAEGLAGNMPSDTEIVEMALKELIRQGYRSHVALVHVILEARRQFGDQWGRERTNEIPRWQNPKWVGQIARNYGYVTHQTERPRLWNRQHRIMTLEPSFVERTLKELAEEGRDLDPPKMPLAFCLNVSCAECPYVNWCDMKGEKEDWVKKHGQAQVKYAQRQKRVEFEDLTGEDPLGLDANANGKVSTPQGG